jgi:hypothetical protein
VARKKKKKTRDMLRLGATLGIWGFAAFMLLLAWFGIGFPSIDEVKPVAASPGITILASD